MEDEEKVEEKEKNDGYIRVLSEKLPNKDTCACHFAYAPGLLFE